MITHTHIPSGTEFFTEFRTKQWCAEKMFFDWEQAFVNAELKLPDSPLVSELPCDWLDYKVVWRGEGGVWKVLRVSGRCARHPLRTHTQSL